ncbi:MAG: adenylate kinase [Actinomycetota bacterium]
MRAIVLGPPGAGKGTQAGRLAAELGVAYIATGDMFRAMARSETPLAQEVRSYMDRGELVPDELTNRMLEARIEEPDAADGFVLDGYPRDVDQAKRLDDVLAAKNTAVDRVFRFRVTGPEIVARLSGRWVCPADGAAYHVITNPPKVAGICDVDGTPLVQRPDDTEETVKHRLEVFGERTKPLYDFYAARDIMVDVDAIGTTEEVHDRLAQAAGLNGAGGEGKA